MFKTDSEWQKPNTLVAYHGGGRDGSFYEVNYAYFDKDGNFHNIYSSGVFGCDTLEKLKKRFEQDSKFFEFTDVENQEKLQVFADLESVDGVVLCAKWFAINNIDVKLQPKCDCCKERFNAVEGHGENWKVSGGIESSPKDVICSKCWDAYTCSNCNDYYGPKHKFCSTEHFSNACEWCTEKDGGEQN